MTVVGHFPGKRKLNRQVPKLELQQELELPPGLAVPLFGNIGRLVEQKGIPILLEALEQTLDADLQFLLLGTGSPGLERDCQHLGRRLPSRVAVRIGFDGGLSHRVEAGCDFFLMPSRFEPCGLNQMYALRYGTIPIVRATGGLEDTVIDARQDALRANGIKFNEYSAPALAKAIRKALALFQEPPALAHFRANAMAADFSWARAADHYVAAYKRALGRK